MKLNRLLIGTLAIGAMLASCSKEADEVPSQSVGTAYLTLSLSGSNGLSRTTAGQGTEIGTAEENKISSAMILLANPATHKVLQTYSISSGLIESTDVVTTHPILVQEGTYDVYVIANNNTLASVGTDVTGQSITAITEALMQNTYAAANNFIMFNESNGTDDLGGKTITITAANDYAHPATCDIIKLDRLAVKITNKVSPTFSYSGVTTELNKISNIQLIGAKLINGATKAYLQQHWTGLKPTAPALTYSNTLITPAMNIAEYYNGFSLFRTATYTVNSDGTLQYTVAKDQYSAIPYYNGNLGAIYCMENNSTWNGEKGKFGNTTGIMYQWQATVTGSDGVAGTNCFYGYDGKYFSSLSDIQLTYPGVFSKATGATNPAKLAAATTELTNAYTTGEDAISAFRVKYGINVYTNGNVYYSYFIKDANYLDGNGLHDYAIMRNTIYGLTVKSLTRIGTDIPGGWIPNTNPEDPIENNDVYMIVSVVVNPWVLSNINIDLK